MNFIFPYIGNNNPNWLSYFSEGLKPPTSLGLRWAVSFCLGSCWWKNACQGLHPEISQALTPSADDHCWCPMMGRHLFVDSMFFMELGYCCTKPRRRVLRVVKRVKCLWFVLSCWVQLDILCVIMIVWMIVWSLYPFCFMKKLCPPTLGGKIFT